MTLVFSTNNRYVGLDGFPSPNFSRAWFSLKEFMVNSAGWSVTQSGAQNYSNSGDIIVDHSDGYGGMSSPTVWWVLRDPGGKRELLFYRPNAINSSNFATASYMAIAYSAGSKFSTTLGLGGNPVSATNPPIANDMVWLHQPDNFAGNSPGTLAVPGNMTDDVNWGGDINYATSWNFHMCADLDSPYSFYFWFTRQSETTGFFCMDGLTNVHPLDTDNVLFYHFPQMGGMVNLLGSAQLKSWYKKPSTFVNRADFANKITNNEAGFLLTQVLSYNYEQNQVAIPRGMPASLYTAKELLFPVMYLRNTSAPYPNPILELPASYKGISSFVQMLASAREQFDTVSVMTVRDKIAVGINPIIVVPWDGSIINIA
jgi:hypothetical protein